MRLARMGLGMTLTKLSEVTGRSLAYLSKMEHDERPLSPEICYVLDIDESNGEGLDWYFQIVSAVKDLANAEIVVDALDRALGVKASPGP